METISGVTSRRAKPGDTIILYGIGFGAVDPSIPAGRLVGDMNTLAAAFEMSFGGTLNGRDHLIVRMFIQLGLHAEELFALRRDDVQGDQLRIDEALVIGKSATVKTYSSEASVYIPPEVNIELTTWMQCHPGPPRDWLFQTTHGRPGFLNPNNYRKRILQPAAIRANVGVIDTGKRDEKGKAIVKTDVNFPSLRRTCATLFGDRAKDPKSTQAQLRHADPSITLRHYQKSIPSSVRAAVDQLERDLGFGLPGGQIDDPSLQIPSKRQSF